MRIPTSEMVHDGSNILSNMEEKDKIVIFIGERRFVSSREALIRGSGHFKVLLQNPGVVTIQLVDADPTLFEHILRFLKRGIFPLFFSQAEGHNHSSYLMLLQEARYFAIPLLVKWLEDKTYLEAVKFEHVLSEHQDLGTLQCQLGTVVDIHPVKHVEKVYICPRGIFVHMGDQSACGRQCNNAKDNGVNTFGDVLRMKFYVVEKRTVLDEALCISVQD